ncbi:MerR family transcriptional regulator [Hyella patelloides LEGE 07179]|uniref:MerR family transcriptional regulator n=1 Tax=Hyella patelloides LEGE 07179 TaxID=945734 RepID=A0A563VMW7_9CYAN|nr:precorrin-8X methylmutase [Hyella patelloides]VEP12707.1 MerR family transcriptional regulator [Hyella patelloides LEGE 07179]
MTNQNLTIKQLTEKVGNGLTPRMVRYYHQIGLLPEASRSPSNYRLYSESHVQQLQTIVALKQQGFQLEHIRKLLTTETLPPASDTLLPQLQQQYRTVIEQIAKLRQTASALEGLLGRDNLCQTVRTEAIAKLQLSETATFWDALDTATPAHPESFSESLKLLLPDLSERSEIEADLLAQLVLACGDVSLINFVQVSSGAIAAAREALKSGCQIVGDVSAIVAACDRPRLAHLGCQIITLIDNPHLTDAAEAEQEFWSSTAWHKDIQQLSSGCILVIGYAPSILISVCRAIKNDLIHPALIIGMPIGFSHAPAAKRLLMRSGIPFITIVGSLGGGLLAATALNALAQSTIEKPNCHCYLSKGNIHE